MLDVGGDGESVVEVGWHKSARDRRELVLIFTCKLSTKSWGSYFPCDCQLSAGTHNCKHEINALDYHVEVILGFRTIIFYPRVIESVSLLLFHAEIVVIEYMTAE